jgi:hypothetical protein
LTQFNPKDYWEERKDYVEWNGNEWDEEDYYYETPTGAFKKVNKEIEKVPDGGKVYYIKVENGNTNAVELSKAAADKIYLKNIMTVPLKVIYLK